LLGGGADGGTVRQIDVLANVATRGGGMAGGSGNKELFGDLGLVAHGERSDVQRLREVYGGEPTGTDNLGQQRGGMVGLGAAHGKEGVTADAVAQQRVANQRRFFECQARSDFHKMPRLFEGRRLIGNGGRGGQGRHTSSIV